MKDEVQKDFGTRETGMNVPAGYFADFASRMDTLIDAEEQACRATETEAPKVSLWTMVKPWLYMAAMFASFAVLFRVLLVSEAASEEQQLVAQTEEQAIVDDLIYGDVSDYDLFEYLYASVE